MIQRAFQHRSGRVISLGRLVLAGVFLLAIWADPSQPSRYAAEAYLILAIYLSTAALYLALTWSNWWLEVRLSPWAHVVDITLFGVMVFLTEGYTSPFFTFSVFIILSAAIKWSWRETAFTAALLILLFFAGGFAAIRWGAVDFAIDRFIIRGTYLTVLSLVLIWFGINQRGAYLRHLARFEGNGADGKPGLPIDRILRFTAEVSGATQVAMLWWDEEEPWVHLATLSDDEIGEQRHGPQAFGRLVHPDLENRTFLFDNRKSRALVQRDGGHHCVRLADPPVGPRLEETIGCVGLAIPVESQVHKGIVFLTGIPGLCVDDIAIGEHIRTEISAELQRASAIGLSQEAAAGRTRLSLARDLHDSVVQLLAGTSFRLEGIRRSVEGGRDPRPDIDALQQELGTEQRELRGFIRQLRDGAASGSTPGVRPMLLDLLERVERQWGVACVLERCPSDLTIGPQLIHDVQQLVREGVSNAVRHGGADLVTVSLDGGSAGISLIVADNGSGFPGAADEGKKVVGTNKPWSLNERVHQLGGSLALYSGRDGTRITISLPYRAGA